MTRKPVARPSKPKAHTGEKQLRHLKNVDPATLGDFAVLGITSLKQLAARDAFELYEDLCRRTDCRHDPCCIDVFMATIDEARGNPPRVWWHYTKERKRILANRTRNKQS